MNVRQKPYNKIGTIFDLSADLNTFSLRIWAAVFLLLIVSTSCSRASTGSAIDRLSPRRDAAEDLSTGMPFSENSTIFEIIPAESEARFLVDEILNGEEKRVIGKTNQVGGQIAFDLADLSAAAAGPIEVNARTFETDNGFRNRAVQNRILLSGIYEFITFTPTAINGLPENIEVGEVVEFQMEGDLTITAYTQPVTFAVTAVLLSESRLEGSATTSINRDDFDLVVPSATGVAAVGEAVILDLDFVATAVELG